MTFCTMTGTTSSWMRKLSRVQWLPLVLIAGLLASCESELTGPAADVPEIDPVPAHQFPMPDGAALRSVDFSDASSGIAVGQGAEVWTTADGGATWTDATQAEGPDLWGVSFVGTGTAYAAAGYAVGRDGLVVGDSIPSLPGVATGVLRNPAAWLGDLYDIAFFDGTGAVAVGSRGTLVRLALEDSLVSFTNMAAVTTRTLFAISFEGSTGFAVGQDGVILSTLNAGTSWSVNDTITDHYLYDVEMIDSNTATCVGNNGTIVRTVNGGIDWSSQDSNTNLWLHDVEFADVDHGFAAGEDGTILHTSDGGSTWVFQSSGTVNWLYAIAVRDANNVTIVGNGGTILQTQDAGATWVARTPAN